MRFVTTLSVVFFAIGVIGCSLGADEGAEMALRIVQDFKPSESSGSILQMLNSGSPNDQWIVSKTSEDLYRVTYKGGATDKKQDLVFGVSIHKRTVMALNSSALAFTNPL